MQRKKIDVDVIRDILDAARAGYPDSAFIKSLSVQYEERGGLSKKQLEGLYAKSLRLKDIPPQKMATLNAVIQNKPTRFKSEKPAPKPLFEKDELTGKIIADILARYPDHKRVLYLNAKYSRNEPLAAAEITKLEKFRKLLLKD